MRSSGREITRQRRGPAATGEVLNRGGAFAVCLGRSFTVPPETVWDWLTAPDKMRIWLGESLPVTDESGAHHLFHLAGDARDAPRLDYDVERVVPRQQLTVSLRESGAGDTVADGGSWRLDLTLSPTEIGSHLMLEQTISDRVPAPTVAAGCEFYLDRLVRACHGRPFGDLDYDDYFLAQGPAYRRMFPLPRQDVAQDAAGSS